MTRLATGLGDAATVLAHAGEGAGWQALLTSLSAGLVVVVLLAVFGRVRLERADDLTLPLASVAILAGLGTSASDTLSDAVGYAFPVGVVALVVLLGTALTPVRLLAFPPLLASTAIAVAASLILGPILTDAWHPLPDFLPTPDDAVITITAPTEGEAVDGGPITITVRVDNGSIGPLVVPQADAPVDDEELGHLHLYIDGKLREMVVTDECTVEVPCTETSFEVELPSGQHVITVEFVTWDHLPFAPTIEDSVTVTVA